MNRLLSVRRIPIGLAFAANQVNATVFRVSSLTTAGDKQYAVYYEPGGAVVVAKRDVAKDVWEIVKTPAVGHIRDAHNDAVLGVSSDGVLHLAYDHHGHPLHYRRSLRPGDIREWSEPVPMTGKTEGRVTYPQFVAAKSGTLLFFYRDGQSGNGRLCVNRYDAARKKWDVLHHPLVDGVNQCNPYWWRPAFGPDNRLHLAWCWRDSGDARTNHDICYAFSPDYGKTWRRSDNSAQPLPVTPGNADIADPIPTGSNLINQCSSTVDDRGRPHLAHYQNDADGIPQYTHLYHDGKRWARNVVSRRKSRFSLSGGGTLKIPISRPEIAALRDGTIVFITRDEAEANNGIRLYVSAGRDYSRWEPLDIFPENPGEWEPTYDTARLRDSGILSLFVLPVRQGNHETVTDFPPQEASVLEVRLRG